jgi:hypothetical protein
LAPRIEQGRADQPLDRAEAGAEHPVDRTDHRRLTPAADRRDQLAAEEDEAEDDDEGEHRGSR